MTKHGRILAVRERWVLFGCALLLVFTSMGCAVPHAMKSSKFSRTLSPEEVAARNLRKAQIKIESLKERNQILRMRLKMLTRGGAVVPLAIEESSDSLKGFEAGVVTDVPLDLRKPVKPKPPQRQAPEEKVQNALDLRAIGQIPAALPQKRLSRRQEALSSGTRLVEKSAFSEKTFEQSIGEQADGALSRTILGQLKEADVSGAERTMRLLEKSYPDSLALAEARFQMGLFHYRQRVKAQGPQAVEAALRSADFHFSEAQRMSSSMPRIHAGSALMRGVIARLLLQAGGEVRNRQIARRNFEFVMNQYPKTMEARRARRELAFMDRRAR
jgi:TolA-binding protein